jgi:hypothetical protein
MTGCRHITDAALDTFGHITSLHVLALNDCKEITDCGISSLSGLTNLRQIELRGCNRITDAAVAVLAEFPRIETVELNGCPVSDHTFELLSRRDTLRRLSFGSPHITDTGIKLLERLPALEWLTIDQSMQLTDSTLLTITSMPSLETVRLFRSPRYSKKAWNKLMKSGKTYVYWEKDAEVS